MHRTQKKVYLANKNFIIRPINSTSKLDVVFFPAINTVNIVQMLKLGNRMLSTGQFRICVFYFTKIIKILNFRENTHI